MPLFLYRYTLITANLGRVQVNMWIFYDVFVIMGWPQLIFAMGVVSFVHFVSFMREADQNILSSLFKAVTAVGHHFIQTDNNYSPDTLSKKILNFTSMAFAFAGFTVYSSLLTTTMTLAPKVPPIRNFEEMHSQGYQLLVWKNSILLNSFERSPAGSTKHMIAESIKKQPKTQFTSYKEMEQILKENDKTMAFAIENSPATGVTASRVGSEISAGWNSPPARMRRVLSATVSVGSSSAEGQSHHCYRHTH